MILLKETYNTKNETLMSLERYINRELKEDIKWLIKKVIELEKKIEELEKKIEESKPSQKVYTESEKMQDELEPIITAPMMDME